MQKRRVIITGANSGIGKAAALKFATMGHTVIMACRNLEISRKVHQEVIDLSKNNQTDLMKVDLSSFHSIRNFRNEYKEKYEKLDVLIHNAAYFNHGEKYQLSPDQIELTFATNLYEPYLMTALFLDHLKKSEDPRILFAGSNIIKHFFNPKKGIILDNLHGEFKESRRHSIYQNYRDSKWPCYYLRLK